MKIRSSPMMSTNDELWSNATTLTKFNLGSSILDEYEKETQLFYPFSEKNDHHILHQSSTTEGDNNSDSPKKLKVYKEENHKLNTEQNPSESEQGSALINDDSSFKLLDELSLKFNAETDPNPGNQHIDSECQHIKCHQVECQYNEHQYVKRKQVQCKHVKCQNIECQHVKSQQHLSLEGDGISKGTGVEDPGSQQTTTKRQHIVETKGYIVSGIAIRGLPFCMLTGCSGSKHMVKLRPVDLQALRLPPNQDSYICLWHYRRSKLSKSQLINYYIQNNRLVPDGAFLEPKLHSRVRKSEICRC